MREVEGPRFITVDLEVWSKADLAPLAKALEPRSFVLYVGRAKRKFLASFEAHGASPEETIWRLLDLVKPLRGRARQLWREADVRVFNIGFESGNTVALMHETPPGSGVWEQRGKIKLNACETSLRGDVLQAIADVRGTVTTTIYPPQREVRAKRRDSTEMRSRLRPPNPPLQSDGRIGRSAPSRARR
jgi:hypothetical protein